LTSWGERDSLSLLTASSWACWFSFEVSYFMVRGYTETVYTPLFRLRCFEADIDRVSRFFTSAGGFARIF